MSDIINKKCTGCSVMDGDIVLISHKNIIDFIIAY